MTQENDSAQSSGGATPGKAAALPKKPQRGTRNTTSPKPAGKPADQDSGNPPPKKPRGPAKKPAKSAGETAAPSQPEALKPKESGTGQPKETPASKPAAAKTGPAPRRSPKPKPETKPAGNAEEGIVAPATDAAPAARESAPAKTVSKNRTARGRSGKTPTTPDTTAAKDQKPISPAPSRQPEAERTAEPAAAKDAFRETTPQELPAIPQPESAPAQPGAAAPAGSQAGPQPQADLQKGEAKPSSRRSRRGGRRRNKSKNGANAAQSAGTAVAEAETEAAQSVTEKDKAASRETDGRDAPQTEQAPKDGQKRKSSDKGKTKPESKTGAEEPAAATPKTSGGKRKMFISVLSGELVEVILAEEGAVVEYYVEMQHQAKVKGNIYKGVVSNIDANLQAAFVSYAGGVKNGFLQIDEVHPEYYIAHQDPAKGRKYPPIQKVLKPGQEILIQVVKEPSGTKGAFLTSYLSLPGRFIVLTPGREQIGVSRKVDDDEERIRLRAMLEGLKPGAGLGVIVRTASTGASKTSLQRDLQFLKRLWKDVRAMGQNVTAPSLIYEELDLSTRAVRDYLTDDVQEVWVDDAATAGQVKELASLLFPKKQNLVQVHTDGAQSLFERFSLQKQLDQIHSREVSLPSGGRLVIDNTEALTAIDINSGRSSGKSNFEDMAFRTNLEAARAIPLQLRLRDIGGQIVADFIEMRDRDHWREVEKIIRNGMKGDRARYDVGKIGPFGMLEIVRQRLGSSAISISTEPCPCCKGTGIRRNMEWQAMQALRDIGKLMRQAAINNQPSMTYQTERELALYLLNTKRAILQNLEEDSGVSLVIAMNTE